MCLQNAYPINNQQLVQIKNSQNSIMRKQPLSLNRSKKFEHLRHQKQVRTLAVWNHGAAWALLSSDDILLVKKWLTTN